MIYLVIKMDCIFCKIINNEISSYKIYENDMVLCFLDINPLSSGHTLIIPKKHFKDISDIDSKYLSSINDATKYVYNLLMSKLGPDGIRIVQNNGICQEIKHYHVHLIPVYNDMLDMDIEEVYNKIKDSN
jgi:histidine triad (HIT) family protein